ncbi:MAG: YlxM family DNA-binding protein [Kyrpidia sp.]|nr:YlxM family DNA-binding protein [Kyrpidia sp.]
MLDKTTRVNLLYDHYGGLLTEKQRRFVELHYFEDLSLGEIADLFGVSRQAVHDHLKRAVDQLEQYETVLGLAGRGVRKRAVRARLNGEIAGLPVDERRKERLLRLIDSLCEEDEGTGPHPEGDGRDV